MTSLSPRKNILIITYHLPPCGGVTSLRIAKFLKYLSSSHFSLYVLSVRENAYAQHDPSLTKDIQHIPIKRTFYFKRSRCMPKDEGLFWLPFYVPAIINTVFAKRPALIFFNTSPFYILLIIPFLKMITDAKLVVDMRDPWRLNPFKPKGFYAPLANLIDRIAEPFVLRYSSLVINATEYATRMYQNQYKTMRHKFITVYNGYDPEDVHRTGLRDTKSKGSGFDIIYAGGFYDYRAPRSFLAGFEKFIHDAHLTEKEIRFIVLGKTEELFLSAVHELKLNTFCFSSGHLPYDDTLHCIKRADLCLVVGGDHPYQIPTKVFEYIGFGKPIMGCLQSEGELSLLLNRYPLARYTIRGTTEEIATMLHSFYFKRNNRAADMNGFYRALDPMINRKTQAKLLEKIFDTLLLAR